MKDQNLYEYFASRKHLCDEMPPAELWDKISLQLQQPAPKSKFWSAGKIMLLLLPIVAASIYFLSINVEIPKSLHELPPTNELNSNPNQSDRTVLTPMVRDSLTATGSLKEQSENSDKNELLTTTRQHSSAAQNDSLTSNALNPNDMVRNRAINVQAPPSARAPQFTVKSPIADDSIKAFFIKTTPVPKTGRIMLDSIFRKKDSQNSPKQSPSDIRFHR